MSLNDLNTDGKRQMQICNACRYCEGYCAVWHAIEYRLEFSDKDMAYLANLCHDCRDCYFACPFTAPHEFGINPPKLFGGLREELYRKYAWPRGLAMAIGSKKLSFWLVSIIALVLLLITVFGISGLSVFWKTHIGTGAFYKVTSELLLEVIFGLLGLWFVAGWIASAVRFWLDIKSSSSQKVIVQDISSAVLYAAKLRYLGRESADEELAGSRKWFHHFVFYGFLLDFASTTLGAVYSHLLHIQAPYPVYNPVVILGILGGLGIIIGVSGLLYVKLQSNPVASDESTKKSGDAFSISLLAIAVTGMLVLLFRDTPAMGVLLIVHLSTVASLFFTAPYSKFAHFIYRFMALVRYAQEERVAHTSEQIQVKKAISSEKASISQINK